MKKASLIKAALIAALGLLIALFVLVLQMCKASELAPTPTPQPSITIFEPTATTNPTPIPIEILPGEEQCKPTETLKPTQTPMPSNKPAPQVSSNAFTLTILDKQISVAGNVDERTLEKSPGWLPSSASPGNEGMCVVYGHRNRNHLLILEKVKLGDLITVTMPEGSTFSYTVEDIQTIESSADLRLPAREGKTMALITCYPFRYSGHAPGKYLVVATLR